LTTEAVILELLKKARTILYHDLPESSWFSQQGRVKFALTLPSKWLDERKVELSPDRYKAIVDGILDTIRTNRRPDLGAFPCAYLHACVEAHIRHHGDEYYAEGKSVRTALDRVVNHAARARLGAGTIPILAQVHATLAIGKRKPKVKPVAPEQLGLF
jgi:hypothetical protein